MLIILILIMGVVAVYNVRRDIMMKDPREELNAYNAGKKTANGGPRGSRQGHTSLSQVSFSLWEHVVQSRKEHDTKAEAE